MQHIYKGQTFYTSSFHLDPEKNPLYQGCMKNCLVKKSILPENPCLGEQGFFFVEDYKRGCNKKTTLVYQNELKLKIRYFI
ncbi:hypothetical protein AMS61_25715 [Bacillus sp. FJAT-21351]|jgi:hypothetical protein|nr:hypothetical protein AMS61_25715 [Bacillus sp. FJAT-21351]